MILNLSFVASGGSAWLGYSGSGTHLASYEAGRWTASTLPTSSLYTYPVVALASGGAWVAWTDPGGKATEIHVAHRSAGAWVAVGGPVGAYPDAFTNAGEQALAIDGAGHPIVVWSESKPGSGGGAPASLEAARWDGTTWVSLGTIDPNVQRPVPSLALDATGTPWVTWIHGSLARPILHVVRLTAKGWLAAPVAEGTRALDPHIVIEPEGTAFVSWTSVPAGGVPHFGDGSLGAARTDGTTWTATSVPTTAAVRDTALQLVGGVPVLAWSEAVGKEIASAAVARFVGGRWEDVLRGMQADTGQSDVGRVALAPSEKGLYLAWDEAGADAIRTRVIEAHPCGAGERPSAIPTSKPRASFWPKTVDDAVTQILSTMDEAAKKRVRETPRGDLIQFHLTWGTGIRNEMGLWGGNKALLESCHTTNAEDCSGIIIEKTWERLQPAGPPQDR